MQVVGCLTSLPPPPTSQTDFGLGLTMSGRKEIQQGPESKAKEKTRGKTRGMEEGCSFPPTCAEDCSSAVPEHSGVGKGHQTSPTRDAL